METLEYVYILSASHSGSTLLTLLMGAHPDLASIGESSAVLWHGEGDTGLCSCGAAVRECGFWRQIAQRLEAKGVDWDAPGFSTEFRLPDAPRTDRVLRAEYRGPLFEAVRNAWLAVHPRWRRRQREILKANRALFESVLELTGARIFVDSSKEPHRLKFLMAISDLRLKVIHLVRDGRGVAGSYIRRSNWPMERAADEWRRSLLSEEALLRWAPSENVLLVRYEDLCRDVDREMSKILRFVGAGPEKWSRAFREVKQHVLGNRMRLGRENLVRLDERWRGELTEAQLRLFEAIGGEINRRYRYSDELAEAAAQG